MNNSISINMKFWDDGQKQSTRIRNVKYSWCELKKLHLFLIKNNINCNINLYDFSPQKIIEDSIHVSYPLGEYKKAEKTNIILRQQQNYSFFMMIDCDAFFDIEDYVKLLDIIKQLDTGDIITFDLAKLNNFIDNKFVKEQADWSYAYSGDKNNGPLNSHTGGLGGVYIADTSLLLSLGGFDEKYVGWGGEDGDMLSRICISKIKHNIKPTKNFAPFHLPHYCDLSNILYTQRFKN